VLYAYFKCRMFKTHIFAVLTLQFHIVSPIIYLCRLNIYSSGGGIEIAVGLIQMQNF